MAEPIKHASNMKFANSMPYQLHKLVLDYLCHNCYTATARAFIRDTTIKHLDADGDEIMEPAKGLAEVDDASQLMDELLRQVELREQIRICILSGRVDEAIEMLNKHFPSVLDTSSGDSSPLDSPQAKTVSGEVDYVAPTSVNPSHICLNLRILAFIEACRTIPLPYPPPRPTPNVSTNSVDTAASRLNDGTHSISSKSFLFSPSDPTDLPHQEALLTRAQKLYAFANTLPNTTDRATYLKELGNVGGLLAYKIPEHSSIGKYLSQERREAVADQVNSAILYRMGQPPVSYLQLHTRYTSTLWSYLHDLRVKPPPAGNQPPGFLLPPTHVDGPRNVAGKGDEPVPPFNLQIFLDSKS